MCSTHPCACVMYKDMPEMEDLCKATGARTCIYTTHECEELSYLSEDIRRATTYQDQIQLKEVKLRIYTGRLVTKTEKL